MTSPLARALACGALAAFLGAALVALFYGLGRLLVIEFDRELPRLVSGIYPPERDDATGLTFAWTGADVALQLRGLDRRVDWTLTARLRGARPEPDENPEVAVAVDGVLLASRQTRSEFEDMRITIPARPERRGAVITLRASRTFNPGPSDPRELALMLDRLEMTPSAVVFPAGHVVGAAAIAAGAIGFALALMGAFDMVSVYVRETLLQLWTPDAVRGRVNAVNMVFVGASNELGEFRAGISAALIGTVPAVLVGGIGTVAVALLWAKWFPELRRARHLDSRS